MNKNKADIHSHTQYTQSRWAHFYVCKACKLTITIVSVADEALLIYYSHSMGIIIWPMQMKSNEMKLNFSPTKWVHKYDAYWT